MVKVVHSLGYWGETPHNYMFNIRRIIPILKHRLLSMFAADSSSISGQTIYLDLHIKLNNTDNLYTRRELEL
jgi:hypothetical protein